MPPGGGSSTYRSLRREIRAEAKRVVVADKGRHFRFGAIRARILSPPHAAADPNEASVVLLLTVAGKRVLLTGDLTGANEARVGNVVERGPPVYLLKVAHHGSRFSTSASFLADVDPRFAVICVGPNSYGHPTPQTIRRLRRSGARIYATQTNGTITVTIGPAGKVRWSFSRNGKPITGAGAFGG